MQITAGEKPSTATWMAKARVSPDGTVVMNPSAHPDPAVDVFWYPDGSVKVVVRGTIPLTFDQTYRTPKGQAVVQMVPR